jgi:hypothetical protein
MVDLFSSSKKRKKEKEKKRAPSVCGCRKRD